MRSPHGRDQSGFEGTGSSLEEETYDQSESFFLVHTNRFEPDHAETLVKSSTSTSINLDGGPWKTFKKARRPSCQGISQNI